MASTLTPTALAHSDTLADVDRSLDAGVRAGGAAVALVGTVTLLGWLLDNRYLSAAHPDFIPTAPNTALLFLVLGLSLCLLTLSSPRARRLAQVGIGVALLVSLSRLAEYVVAVELGVDSWLFAFPSESFGLAPVGRMAFFTALTFVLACLALAAQSLTGPRSLGDLSRALGLLVALIGVVFSLGYVYDAPLLYGGRVIPMALPTAVGFMVLGMSIVIPGTLRDRADRKVADRALRAAHAELERRVSERTAELESQTAEAELAKRQAHALQEQYRSLVDGLAIGVVLMTPSGIQTANPSAERILALSIDQMRGRTTMDRRWRAIHEDGSPFPGEEHPVARSLRLGESHRNVIMGVHRPDATMAWIEISSDPLLQPGDRTPRAAVASFVDITERKRAEEELRKSEEQLRQSQKMEAVGQLAGGVAHDFNNMLTAIKSYADLLHGDVRLDDEQRRDISEIRGAADRAASLTRQLLAFGRRQVMHLRPTDLNDVVRNMEGMLRRLLVADARLVTTLSSDIGLVKVDQGQVEQVLMNLVVNARDAMPEGGCITLQTETVILDEAYCREHVAAQPGPHVRLSVADTGIGMDEATRHRIFEPFFTTKERGKGTGLGLSTVYGIVKQSGGHIWVYSEVGHGAVFKIYFPRVDGVVAVRTPSIVPTVLARGSETVLLVDDEETVRRPVRKILERSGYTVIEAESGEQAIRVFEQHAGLIKLIITDMMMPGMHGGELIDRIATLSASTHVLFTSGYADEHFQQRGLLDADAAFLQKPFTLDALLEKIREVLHA